LIKTKIYLSQAKITLAYFGFPAYTLWSTCPRRHLNMLPSNLFTERTWWSLFQKRVVCTRLDIRGFLLLIVGTNILKLYNKDVLLINY